MRKTLQSAEAEISTREWDVWRGADRWGNVFTALVLIVIGALVLTSVI
jgi:hypothetical protein